MPSDLPTSGKAGYLDLQEFLLYLISASNRQEVNYFSIKFDGRLGQENYSGGLGVK
jgi:hypothetical protein